MITANILFELELFFYETTFELWGTIVRYFQYSSKIRVFWGGLDSNVMNLNETIGRIAKHTCSNDLEWSENKWRRASPNHIKSGKSSKFVVLSGDTSITKPNPNPKISGKWVYSPKNSWEQKFRTNPPQTGTLELLIWTKRRNQENRLNLLFWVVIPP